MHWLDRYSSDYHSWHSRTQPDGSTCHYRRIGIVESFFDSDGLDFEGRADISGLLTVKVSNLLPKDRLRRRILNAWATLRTKHVLLASRAVNGHELPPDMQLPGTEDERFFVIDAPATDDRVLENARGSITFVEDHYATIDPQRFYHHVMNTARCLDAHRDLAHLYVLPVASSTQLQFVLVVGHQIADGLTNLAWNASFAHLLSLSDARLRSSWSTLLQHEAFVSRLPPAQEDQYPKVYPGNRPRQRWHWAIARVLRHVHRAVPRSFINPLVRQGGPVKPQLPLPIFDRVLNYDPSRTPPLNSGFETLTLPPAAAAHLLRECRSLGVSVGAGTFALVGMSMMALRERFPPPGDPDHEASSLPFVGSFPIDARPFFGYRGTADSAMLAFSYGILLPFLNPSLPAKSRFRLLVRQVDRQLAVYQKGARAGRKARVLGAASSQQLVPIGYISNVEWAEMKRTAEMREKRALAGWRMPQGDLKTPPFNGLATCGVSSTGDRHRQLLGLQQQFVSDSILNGTGQDKEDNDSSGWQVEFDDLLAGVRPRDREFLVRGGSDAHGFRFSVSYDACALDEQKVCVWRELMESLLDDEPAEIRAT